MISATIVNLLYVTIYLRIGLVLSICLTGTSVRLVSCARCLCGIFGLGFRCCKSTILLLCVPCGCFAGFWRNHRMLRSVSLCALSRRRNIGLGVVFRLRRYSCCWDCRTRNHPLYSAVAHSCPAWNSNWCTLPRILIILSILQSCTAQQWMQS